MDEKTLAAAGKKAEKQKSERQARAVKGAHLSPKFTEIVAASGLATAEKTGWIQVTAPSKAKKIYIAKKGGRVDFSGFSITGPGTTQISAEDAKAKHLGKVRGQIDFEADDQTVVDAFEQAIAELKASVPAPAPEPKPKAEKKPKAAKPGETSGQAQASA